MYELFDHTADLGVRVVAHDLDTLFAEAAEALFSVIVEDVPVSPAPHPISFHVDAAEIDDLLVDWLSELLYVFETRRLLLRDFEVRLKAAGLDASASAQPFDPAIHQLSHEVKAVTYHGLKVEPIAEGWRAELILDI